MIVVFAAAMARMAAMSIASATPTMSQPMAKSSSDMGRGSQGSGHSQCSRMAAATAAM
jgi:hypothetical protein